MSDETIARLQKWATDTHRSSFGPFWRGEGGEASIAYHGARMTAALEVLEILDGREPAFIGTQPAEVVR